MIPDLKCVLFVVDCVTLSVLFGELFNVCVCLACLCFVAGLRCDVVCFVLFWCCVFVCGLFFFFFFFFFCLMSLRVLFVTDCVAWFVFVCGCVRLCVCDVVCLCALCSANEMCIGMFCL